MSTSFVGRPAVDTFRLLCLVQVLEGYAKGYSLARNVSKTRALVLATEVTGKTYRRGQHAIAAQDVRTHYEQAKSERVVTVEDGHVTVE